MIGKAYDFCGVNRGTRLTYGLQEGGEFYTIFEIDLLLRNIVHT